MTTTEHPSAPPEWEVAARRHTHLPTVFAEPETDTAMEMPTVLLPVLPHIRWDHLRRHSAKKFEAAHRDMTDSMSALQVRVAAEGAALIAEIEDYLTAHTSVVHNRKWLARFFRKGTR